MDKENGSIPEDFLSELGFILGKAHEYISCNSEFQLTDIIIRRRDLMKMMSELNGFGIHQEVEDEYKKRLSTTIALFDEKLNILTKQWNIHVPKFDGSLHNFTKFYDSFNLKIHYNSALSDLEKFHLLLSSVENEAYELIKLIELSPSNYVEAYELIKTKYGTHKYIVFENISKFIDIDNRVGPEFEKLKQLVHKTRSALSSLSSLGVPIENWDPLIIYILLSKLNRQTRHKWEHAQQDSTHVGQVRDLLNFLEERANTLQSQYQALHEITGSTTSKRSHTKRKHHSRECGRCGVNHSVTGCLALGKLCEKCGHKNHLSQMCNTIHLSSVSKNNEKLEMDQLFLDDLTSSNASASSSSKVNRSYWFEDVFIFGEKSINKMSSDDNLPLTSTREEFLI